MITALIDSNHPGTKHFEEIAKRFDINKDFNIQESFVDIITKDVLIKLKALNVGYDKKILTLINILSSRIKTADFKKFCSVENQRNKGGVRALSIPQLDIQDRLLMWSKMYGVLAISRKPINEDRVSKMEGDFFLAFDATPPFIIAANTSNAEGIFKIIDNAKNDTNDEHLAEITAEFARMIFGKWEEYGSQMDIKPKYEFSFLMNNSNIEC
jgi:hypothetical protein